VTHDDVEGVVKGIVFNLLAELVRRDLGEDTWDDLVDAAGVSGAYTSLGSYEDGEMMRLVGAAAQALHKTPSDVLRWFGRGAMPMLAQKYPAFFDGTGSTRPFLLTLNHIIHPEVRKLYPGADVPVFDYDEPAPDLLVMGYRSARRLCALAEGFVLGAADHFGESVGIEQSQCMHRGDDKCVFRIAFAPRHAAALA
jgi:hypothetical protein